MSSVSIQGNASGTGIFTIASPNSNTNRTLTLPDATGTINTSGAANEVPAGSASTPSIYPAGDTNTGIFFPAADTIAFAEGGTEAMRIDSSGNVGIGVTSIVGKAQINTSDTSTTVLNNAALYLSNSGTATTNQRVDLGLRWQDGTYNGSSAVSAIRESGTSRAASIAFLPSNSSGDATERARITSVGKFFVNATDQLAGYSEQAVITANSTQVALALKSDSASIALATTSTDTSTYNAAIFANNGNFSGALKGSISVSNTGTTYNTTSDYRLKENVAPMTGALATVSALKPCTYTWKDGGEIGQGFIAHELQAVVPDCVTGEKDATETYTDDNGVEHTKPKYQGVDTSFLVATLTAAIQELKAINDAQATRIETLETKVAALEAK